MIFLLSNKHRNLETFNQDAQQRPRHNSIIRDGKGASFATTAVFKKNLGGVGQIPLEAIKIHYHRL